MRQDSTVDPQNRLSGGKYFEAECQARNIIVDQLLDDAPLHFSV
jgi:hypothetical protein